MFYKILHNCATYIPYFALSILLSLFLTYLSIFFLPRLGFVDIPRGRHQHDKPIPRGGGIAVWIAFFVTAILMTVTWSVSNAALYAEAGNFLWKFLPPASLILVAGVVDDRFEIRSWVKLLIQIAAGALIYFEGAGITTVFLYDLPAPLAFAATVMWSVIIINAFNLIDGLDGIAAGLAIISSFLLAVWTLMIGYSNVMVVFLLIFCGCCIGFLRYNFSPARIFMGDTGSMFIGLFFAYVSMQYSTKAVMMTAILVPLAAVGIPMFDVLLAIWRRFFRRFIQKDPDSSIMQGDHDHLHHRIQRETGRTRKTAYIMYLLSLSVCLLAMFSTFCESQIPALAFVLCLLVFFVMIRYSGIELFDTLTSVANGIKRPHRNFVMTASHPVLDVLLLLLAFWLSLNVCRNFFSVNGSSLLTTITHIAPFVFCLCVSGIYRTFWLRAGIIQYYRLIKILGIAGVIGYLSNSVLGVYYYSIPETEMWKHSSFYLIYLLFVFTLILGERFWIHFYESFGYRRLFIRNKGKHSDFERILIYGGGLLCRLYITRAFCSFKGNNDNAKIVGIIDDDHALHRLNVYGFKVIGSIKDLEDIYSAKKITKLVVTCDTLEPEKMAELQSFCRKNGVKLQMFVCRDEVVEL